MFKPHIQLPISQVLLTPRCFHSLVTHALTTEREEILGLLLGHYIETVPPQKDSSDTPIEVSGATVFIEGVHILQRRDKRADRVEVHSNDLSLASQYAESIGLQVVGWYHSHPHITLHPSHVDLQTQKLYQYLDEKFIGIIVSCFDKSKKGIELISFQAYDTKSKYIESYKSSTKHKNLTNSRIPTIHTSRNSMVIEDDIKKVMAKFDHVYSQEEVKSLTELNIPTQVMSNQDPLMKHRITNVDHNLDKMIELVHVLWKEDREAYMKALESCPGKIEDHPLLLLHHSAVFEKSLCRLMEYIVFPMIRAFEKRKDEVLIKLKRLRSSKESKKLNETEIKEEKNEVDVEQGTVS